MEAAAVSQLKTFHQFCVSTTKIASSSPPPPPPPIVSLPAAQENLQNSLKKRVNLRCGQASRLRCAKEEADQMMILMQEEEEGEEEELIGMKKLNEKCKGIGGGIVELMECLEREAIMGEDEGKEPTDYNRRALIFDKSSRVFQALKQQTNSSTV